MEYRVFRYLKILLILLVLMTGISNGQNREKAVISGQFFLDDSWNPVVYLSYIPTFDDMYTMSADMIIAQAAIDSSGCFCFKLDFLPKEQRLYRLHIVKKGDSPSTLIIGGKDENHFFLMADRISDIQISNRFGFPPFHNIEFGNSPSNSELQQVRNRIFNAENTFEESSATKRLLIKKKLEEALLETADTSHFFLVSLYAVYESKFKSEYNSNADFYTAYLRKWKYENNAYYKAFKRQLPQEEGWGIWVFVCIFVAIVFVMFGIWKYTRKRQNKKLQKLSVQERKIFELLREGESNQAISDECNIGLSTVKSHVSSIYSKLRVKSRKEVIDLKL